MTNHTFQDRIRVFSSDHGKLWVLPTAVENVVSWQGSFRIASKNNLRDQILLQIAVRLLDRGSKKRDKYEVADILETRGAQLGFYDDTDRIGFYARSLKSDVLAVLDILYEQVLQPAFLSEEFEKVISEMKTSWARQISDTGTQAKTAVLSKVYPPDHPNYLPPTTSKFEVLAELSVEDVREFYKRMFPGGKWIITAAGDLDETPFTDALNRWSADASYVPEKSTYSHGTETNGAVSAVFLPDRPNLTVCFLQRLPFVRMDPDYLSAKVAAFILGGNFSSRLMTVVREQKGLTYGISSSLGGFDVDTMGHVFVAGSFSTKDLQLGITSTVSELDRFVNHGITAAELVEKKKTITGSYRVGLATTRGLAARMSDYAELGLTPAYLDDYPKMVDSLSVDEVNRVIQTHMTTDAWTMAYAGSFNQEEK